MVNIFFLFVFTITFFLQQFETFASLRHTVSLETKISQFFKTNHSAAIDHSAPHTHESSMATGEAELAEDEDKERSDLELYNDFLTYNAVEELTYQSILRIRYLQLAFSLQKKPEVDFYILYQSWKIHLI